MQLVGRKATNCAHTTFCLLSCTPMSLSWPPRGMTVAYTSSAGAQVAAIVQAASECGLLVAFTSMKLMAKLFIIHGHQHIEWNYTCAVY